MFTGPHVSRLLANEHLHTRASWVICKNHEQKLLSMWICWYHILIWIHNMLCMIQWSCITWWVTQLRQNNMFLYSWWFSNLTYNLRSMNTCGSQWCITFQAAWTRLGCWHRKYLKNFRCLCYLNLFNECKSTVYSRNLHKSSVMTLELCKKNNLYIIHWSLITINLPSLGIQIPPEKVLLVIFGGYKYLLSRCLDV